MATETVCSYKYSPSNLVPPAHVSADSHVIATWICLNKCDGCNHVHGEFTGVVRDVLNGIAKCPKCHLWVSPGRTVEKLYPEFCLASEFYSKSPVCPDCRQSKRIVTDEKTQACLDKLPNECKVIRHIPIQRDCFRCNTQTIQRRNSVGKFDFYECLGCRYRFIH